MGIYFYRDYLGIVFPYSLLTTSKYGCLRGPSATKDSWGCVGVYRFPMASEGTQRHALQRRWL